jgi:hypothetical protein
MKRAMEMGQRWGWQDNILTREANSLFHFSQKRRGRNLLLSLFLRLVDGVVYL